MNRFQSFNRGGAGRQPFGGARPFSAPGASSAFGGRGQRTRSQGPAAPRSNTGGFRRPGQFGSSRFPLFRRGFGRWPVRGFGVVAPSDFIIFIQTALGRALGVALQQTGVMDAATMRALAEFQSTIGLPPTGRVNRPTLQALRGVASTAAPQGPPDIGAAPDGADSVGAGPAGAEEAPQEEFRIKTPGTVTLTRGPSVKLDSFSSLDQVAATLPPQPGVYVVKVNGTPWYVGIAGHSVRSRFDLRWKALRDFNVKPADLRGRELTVYTMSPTQTLQVDYRDGRGPYSPRPALHGVIRAVEQHLINSLGTAVKGNQAQNVITFGDGVWMKLRFAGDGAEPFERSIPLNVSFPKAAH